MIGPCQLSGRETSLTRHHLVLQCRHRNKWNKRNFNRQLAETNSALLCAGCLKQFHVLFSEKELERRLHDLPSLRAEPEVQKFVAWIKNKPQALWSCSVQR